MDVTDKRILEILAQRADTTATDISAAVNLSIPAVNKRIQRLRRNGVIRNFTVLTDGKKAGKGILAFVFLVLQYNAGVEPLMEYILSCHGNQNQYILNKYNKFRSFVESKVKNPFEITKEAGVFVGRKNEQ